MSLESMFSLLLCVVILCLGLPLLVKTKEMPTRAQKRSQKEKKMREDKVKNFIEKNYKALESLLLENNNFDFNVSYMTNDEAYDYYINNQYLFSNFQEYLANNTKLISALNKHGFHYEDMNNKHYKNDKYLEILNHGDDSKELFDTRINGYLGVVKGVKAELEINELLTKYFPSMHAIGSVNLSFGEDNQYHDFENDAILVGKKGIFTIEIKNKTYKVYENGYYEKKLIIYSDGSSSEKDSDLIKQSVEHANLLEVFLTKKFPNIEFLDTIHEIMVIMNEEVEIVNQAPDLYNVVKPAGLRAAINKYPVCLTDEEVKQIIQVLEDNKKEAKKYPFLTVNAPQLDVLIEQQQKLMDAFYEKGYLKNE